MTQISSDNKKEKKKPTDKTVRINRLVSLDSTSALDHCIPH